MKVFLIALCLVCVLLRSHINARSSFNPCGYGSPLEHMDGSGQYFCGLGPFSENCPQGYYCNSAPNDAYAVCCPDSPCQVGLPLKSSSDHEYFCGRGGSLCPAGSHCVDSPVDAYAVCCHN